jgi:DNA mismatch repair protein MutS
MFMLTSLIDNTLDLDKDKDTENETPNMCVKTVLDCSIKNKNECTELVKELIDIKNPSSNSIIDNNAFDDLEIFEGIDEANNSIFNTIDRTKTLAGRILFRNILNSPTTNITTLKTHQKILKTLTKNKQLFENIENKLKEVSNLEENILWILKEKTIEEQKILDSVFFNSKYLQIFNSHEQVLTVYSMFKIVFAPVYGMLSPLLFLIIPYLYLYFFTKVKFDFKTYFKIFKMSFFGDFNLPGMGGGSGGTGKTKYLSMLLSFVIYVQNLMNSIQVAKDNNTTINILHKKINDTNKLVKIVCELKELTKDLHKFEEIKHCFPNIDNQLFETDPCIFSNKGKILTCYNTIQKKEKYSDLLNEIAVIDYYNSIATLIKEHENICFPSYLENENPIINCKQLWHPYLSSPICNDILIGKKNPKNMLITGPNAGGKSTFIKSIAISVIFSQTVGIAFCESFEITPFSLINTYLNIPDCKGKESLFEAEMHRARDHIRKLEDTKKDELSFIVMDEIFNSTNPEEGISGAYAIAEKLSSYKNSVSIITTHFSYLTKLEEQELFKNYKIPITRDQDENIVYPYKIKPGVSNQYIALELLRNKGFNNDLVDNAENICKSLSLNNIGNINKKVETKKVETKKVETKKDNIDLNTLTEPEDNNSEIEFLEDTDTE